MEPSGRAAAHGGVQCSAVECTLSPAFNSMRAACRLMHASANAIARAPVGTWYYTLQKQFFLLQFFWLLLPIPPTHTPPQLPTHPSQPNSGTGTAPAIAIAIPIGGHDPTPTSSAVQCGAPIGTRTANSARNRSVQQTT